MLSKLADRILLAGYELAKDVELMTIIGRFSRGNTAVQDGQIIDEVGVEVLRHDGTKAFERLGKKLRNFAHHGA